MLILEYSSEHAQLLNSKDSSQCCLTLIAPSGDESDVPDAISKMMNNGVKFTQSKESWKIDNENVRVRKFWAVFSRVG